MTMEKFKPGQRAEMEVEITKDLTTNRMGREGADVLSTPALLGLMENASIKVTEPNLPEGHTTVGYAVDGLRHLVATPLGGTIIVKTELTEVDRNRLTFSIEALGYKNCKDSVMGRGFAMGGSVQAIRGTQAICAELVRRASARRFPFPRVGRGLPIGARARRKGCLRLSTLLVTSQPAFRGNEPGERLTALSSGTAGA